MLKTQQPATTINNTTPAQANAFTPQQLTEITAIVQEYLYYGVQCVGTDKAAELLSVEPGTIRAWVKSGKLRASKPGNEYSILIKDIDDMLARYAVVVRMDKRYKKRKAI